MTSCLLNVSAASAKASSSEPRGCTPIDSRYMSPADTPSTGVSGTESNISAADFDSTGE
eukprot:CAMPEP_0175926396 /NCGR_PEP_ID=MMETSP0108-20121206/16164_1 /TAXON_ID=195067 ORGANISM="Goniomonas pacifica, Strain CCMP1869" /NCGR_SAMPLE_ID=MMETSP0108 /ASSEMBLY_ACC=CAM_ASM_000204 /LENGTH=58 /DNA_ID=CAMNT_0017249625 /DNA_START=300 /DNA_END=473 /DNA_ORIENTATION=+